MSLNNPRDFAAGVFLVAVAAFFLWSTWDLPMGGVRLGPGFVPFVLSCAVGLIGVGVMGVGVVGKSTITRPWAFNPRSFMSVLGAILLFGLLIETAGLVVAAPALLLLASFAFGRPRLLETVIFTVFMTTFIIVLFSYALERFQDKRGQTS